MTGIDVPAIRAALAPLVARVRGECRPLVLEFRTVRLGPHSKGDDTRDPAQLAAAARQDWYLHYQAADPERFDALAARQRAHIARVAAEFEARPLIEEGDPCSYCSLETVGELIDAVTTASSVLS